MNGGRLAGDVDHQRRERGRHDGVDFAAQGSSQQRCRINRLDRLAGLLCRGVPIAADEHIADCAGITSPGAVSASGIRLVVVVRTRSVKVPSAAVCARL